MVLSSVEHISLEAFLQKPETKPDLEYVDSQIYQKPMPQGEHSILQGSLLTAINQFSKPKRLACAFPELRCTFAGSSIVPDIAVFAWGRIPLSVNGRIANRFETYPDWTIEILSPDQSANQVIRKITFCLNHGTQLGWLIDTQDESVTIFQPSQTPQVTSNLDILPVLDILKNWQISVVDLFAWLKLE